MTQKRLNIDLIEDLFVREELIRLYEENEQLKQQKEVLNMLSFFIWLLEEKWRENLLTMKVMYE